MPENVGSRGMIIVHEDFMGFDDVTGGTTALPLGSHLNYISLNEGTFGINVSGQGGVLTVNTDTAIGDNVFIYSGPFTPAQGGVAMEARVRTYDVSTDAMYVGFQESISTDDSRMAVNISGTTLEHVGSGGYAGLLFDPLATTDDWRAMAGDLGSLAGGEDLTSTRAYEVPINAEWDVIRVDLGPSGRADMYLNGRLVKSIDSAVTPTDGTYAVVAIENDSHGAASKFEIDYFDVQGNRNWDATSD